MIHSPHSINYSKTFWVSSRPWFKIKIRNGIKNVIMIVPPLIRWTALILEGFEAHFSSKSAADLCVRLQQRHDTIVSALNKRKMQMQSVIEKKQKKMSMCFQQLS